MPEATINLLAVFVAALASYFLGALWYSPVLFGKMYMKMSEIRPGKKPHPNVTRSYIFGFLSTLVMSYVLAHFIDYAGATTAVDGAIAGLWLWLGFIATVTLGSVLWENKSFKMYVLNNTYNLVSLLLMGAILAVWV